MATDRFATEVERQQKYISQLEPDFKFPLFNAMRALESQRRSGYRTTAAAGREIVDNAIEAGATWVHIVMETERTGKRPVSAIAFIDNGSGMLPTMARYALSWGGGTHFDEADFIGKFGFGLPNASINQTRRVEVYTRTDPSKKFTMAHLDITEFKRDGLQSIPEPEEADLPDFVQKYLKQQGLTLDHGTVVVWLNPDRLSYKTSRPLIEHLLDDFGVTYRYLLQSASMPSGTGRFELWVQGGQVEPVDPLFLYPYGRYYLPPSEGGAIPAMDHLIPVKYVENLLTGEHYLQKLEAGEVPDPTDPQLVAVGTIGVKIARFPLGLSDATGDPIAKKRWEIRKSRRGMSFVRAGREIETVDVFPRSARDVNSGMGKWPLLQGYAYYWGIEVSFQPTLDEVFGITNDKQSVRPIEDFWKLVTVEEIDRAAQNEQRWQADERRKARMLKAEQPDGPTPAEIAAQRADAALGRKPKVPSRQEQQVKADFDAEAERRARMLKQSIDDTRKLLEAEVQQRPYRIEYFSNPYGPLYEPKWGLGRQILVRINDQHPFYQTLYGELLALSGGGKAKSSVDVLFIALSKAELTVEEEEMAHWYRVQREQVWSPFLANAMKVLADTAQPEVEEEPDGDDGVAEDQVALA